MAHEANDPSYVEWQAWQLVVQELHRLDIDPNAETSDRLMRAVRAWGELLAELRSTQHPNIVDEARTQSLLAVLNVRSSLGE
jgi:hypothetical protein